jgi:WD40 repeat protein
MAFSPDGLVLAVPFYDASRVVLCDIAKRTVENSLKPPGGTVWSVAFSPDGKYLAAGLARSTAPVCLWDLEAMPNNLR